MTRTEEQLDRCYESIKERIPFAPKAAVVLGSGLGAFAGELSDAREIPYTEIEGFPRSTVSGHAGTFVFGYVDDVPVVVMNGRVHYYEGYSMQEVVLPVRLMRKMGAEILFLSNSAGGLNADFDAGDLMLITGQIASFVPSPLIGPNPESLGTRFPDMTELYDRALCDVIRTQAREMGIALREGTYIQMTGPNYESPEEVRMCRMLGGDAVGMSTACEAIAARHCGFRICGVSCITNPASGLSNQPLSHEEVKRAADAAGPRFCQLVRRSVPRMAERL